MLWLFYFEGMAMVKIKSIVIVLIGLMFFSVTSLSAIEITNKKISRVVGGDEVTNPNSWPWMVALIDSRATSNYDGQFCGGSLIDSKWIVTAAHCLFDGNGNKLNPSIINVLLGTHDLTDGGIRMGINRYIIHPDYNPSRNSSELGSDIALIELKQSIDLPTIEIAEDSEDLTGKDVFALGWGYQYFTNDRYDGAPEKLQQVSIPIISNQECNDAYSTYGFNITEDMLCAGVKIYKNGSVGDSGGPLVIQDEQGWKLVGITNWGMPHLFGVYTKVSNFQNFLSNRDTQEVTKDTNYYIESFYNDYKSYFGEKSGSVYTCYTNWKCQDLSFGKKIAVHKDTYYLMWFSGLYWYGYGSGLNIYSD